MYTNSRFARAQVSNLVRLRENRLKKPEMKFYPTYQVSEDLKHQEKYLDYLRFLKNEEEKKYQLKPKENIPDMKIEDFACRDNWRKLPKLITV